MKATKWLMLVLFLLAVAGIPNSLYAQQITVQILGDPSCTKTSPAGQTWVDISGPCPSTGAPLITISPISTSGTTQQTRAARVEVTLGTSDGTSDSLRIVNALITANASLPTEDNQHIRFSRQATAGPSIPPDVYYKVSPYGSFGPLNNQRINGNSITVNGWVKDLSAVSPTDVPVGNLSPRQYIVTCDPSGCANNINMSATGTPWLSGPLSSDRILTVDFSFALQNVNDTLALSGSGIVIKSGGIPDLTCPPVEPCPSGTIEKRLKALESEMLHRPRVPGPGPGPEKSEKAK